MENRGLECYLKKTNKRSDVHWPKIPLKTTVEDTAVYVYCSFSSIYSFGEVQLSVPRLSDLLQDFVTRVNF